MRMHLASSKSIVWLVIFALVLMWSGYHPKDGFIWFLEVLPALIALAVLAVTRKSFPLTPLAYVLILVHCIILMVGGHYTYAEVPLFDTIRDVFDLQRNNYDKVGHLAQGFVPAVVAREVLIRKKIVNGNTWVAVFAFSLCLAFSAFYEMIEWWVAVATGTAAEAFLATQGYQWDTQADMAYAALGAVMALVFLRNIHDRQILQISSHRIE